MTDIQTSSDNIRTSRVEGAEVRNAAGDHLGTVNDLVVGKRDGKVKYAIMSFGGFLGIGEEYHPLPWDTLDYDESQNAYVVNLSRDQLEGAPRFARDNEYDWSDRDSTRRINEYYGMPPYI